MSVPWYLMAKGKGGGGYKTVSGPIVSISDALAAPLRSLLVNIDPVQAGSGDPSPDNVRPISGWSAVNVWRTGKNLDPYADLNNKNRLWGTPDAYQKMAFQSLPVGTYTLSCKFKVLTNPNDEANVKIGVIARYSDGTGGYVAIIPYNLTTKPATVGAVYEWQYSFTIAESLANEDTLMVYFYCADDGTSAVTANAYDIQIELGSTPTAYAPYSGNQYTLQLGQTVYGGTLDVTNGVLTVDRAYWTKNTADMDNLEEYPGWQNAGVRDFVGADRSGPIQGAILNIGTVVSANTRASNDVCYLPFNKYNKTQTEWIALAMDVQVVFPLATPITIPLTPTEISTLLGQNNVWADTGDVTVEYLSAGGANPDLMKLAVAFMGRR